MAETQVLLPKMGESVAEATITRWLKSVGDKVVAEESLVEIATDKVDSEVPSPAGGVISEILYKEGEVVKVGAAIAIISPEVKQMEKPVAPIIKAPAVSIPANSGNGNITAPALGSKTERFASSGRFYSPLVRNIARKEGIAVHELEKLAGSGKGGRVTKQDILAYLPDRKSETTAFVSPAPVVAPVKENPAPNAPATTYNGSVEIIEMDRMRKLIADHMVMSKHTSAHVTSFVEVDVTNIVQWREKAKAIYEKRDGEKITFTPVFIEAAVKALKDFPLVNSSVDGYKIIRKKYINIGMATALPSGNLIVPVIKNTDHLNLLGLTKAVNDLAGRARVNKLNPDEIQDGTFTITNVGTFGNLMGTPIINQPQVAILATGAIRKKPAVIETPFGDTIGIRHMMFLSLSYDHRVVDGALGGSFLRRVGDYLEKFDLQREI